MFDEPFLNFRYVKNILDLNFFSEDLVTTAIREIAITFIIK